MDRKLTAIMALDVVGYSRMMGTDEAGTLEALKTVRRDIVDPLIAEHRGRIVKLMGDGALVEFASVVDAMASAVDIQKAMEAVDAAPGGGDPIRFRVGINLGDVIVEGDDIYGDGVNIAARLEGLAEPGGICLSRTAFDQVEGKLDVGFAYLGEQQVKNIDKPVRAYSVLLYGKAEDAVVAVPPAKRGSRKPLVIGAVAVVAAVAVGVAALQPWRTGPGPEPQSAAPAPGGKPTVAVLPFDNLSGDPEQDYFADGMSEDLITDLSKVSGLAVISRNSTFRYKGKSVDIRQVGRELGANFVLEGSVRRAQERLRINAQLIDASTGSHLWADRYDNTVADVFSLQDQVTREIVAALEVALLPGEAESIAKVDTANTEAHNYLLRGRQEHARFTWEGAMKAREMFEKAIELDPAYARAYTLLGWHFFDAWRVWGESRSENLARALELGEKAVSLDPTDPAPFVLIAQVHQFSRRFDAAREAADKALALNPNDPLILGNLGSMFRYAGRAEEAVALVERAVRLDPYHPPNYMEWLAHAYFQVGRYEDCVKAAERGIALNADYVALYLNLTQCHVGLEQMEEAQKAAAEMLRTNPRFTVGAYVDYAPFTNEDDREMSAAPLRQAGVPE